MMNGPPQSVLARFASDKGAAERCSGNRPLDMGNPEAAWYVEQGAVDLFFIELKDGMQQAAPQHLLRAETGRLLPGIAKQTQDTTLALIAKGLPGTVLRRLPAEALGAVPHREIAEHIDAWLLDLSAALSGDIEYRPRFDTLIERGQNLEVPEGAHSVRRGVVWVAGMARGAGLHLGLIDPAEGKPGAGSALALTPSSWLILTKPSRLSAFSSESLAEQGRLMPALASFHALACSLARLNRSIAVIDEVNVEREKASGRRGEEEESRRKLFNPYDLLRRDGEQAAGDAMRGVLRLVGRHEDIEFKWPEKTPTSDPDAFMRELLDASGARGRQVRLDHEQKWWIGDSGAMLAFRKQDARPVALLPGALGRYREIDPASGKSRRITAKRAGSLESQAWAFYKPLDVESGATRALLALMKRGLAGNLARFIGVGLLGGLTMLLPAVVLGFLADSVIPSGEKSLLYSAAAALVAAAVVGILLHILQGMSLMRLEGRAASRIEAAFWDRLLRLPASFLKRYPAGDLALRSMTFQNLRDTVQGVVANAVFSILFLSPALALIFFYNSALGAGAAAFGLLSLTATVALGLRQVKPQARLIGTVRNLAGRLFQLIGGISKLRMDGAEASAFAVWADSYREHKRAEWQLGAIEGHQHALAAALPPLAAALLFLMTAMADSKEITVGEFLIIYTLLMLFQGAVARLGEAFGAIAAIAPAIKQIKPFLEEPPEPGAEGEAVEHLSGEILFDHVSFRYDPSGPLVLDNVSIRVRPGEFVAIAGESGCGKSTLFKLALGLLQPSSGAVCYDRRDIRRLNIKQLRRHIAAVPQEVRLGPDDIRDNILGDYQEMSAKDMWEAAKSASVHREISKMPMGMLTCLGSGGDGGSMLSGGESQRIMIASSMARKARVLLLDEATNWLDNENQAVVMRSIAGFTCTRIVIAHRLSTLQEADRILVMRSGRIVEEGSFAELTAAEGIFQDLVRRQMA